MLENVAASTDVDLSRVGLGDPGVYTGDSIDKDFGVGDNTRLGADIEFEYSDGAPDNIGDSGDAGINVTGELGLACLGDCGITALKLKIPADPADGDLGTATDNKRIGTVSLPKDTFDADGGGGNVGGEAVHPKRAVEADIDIAAVNVVFCCAKFVPQPRITSPYKSSMSSTLILETSGPRNFGIHEGCCGFVERLGGSFMFLARVATGQPSGSSAISGEYG